MSETEAYYRDKVAVVTGAASGIGLALAETMLSYGAKRVILVDINEANLTRETGRLNAVYLLQEVDNALEHENPPG